MSDILKQIDDAIFPLSEILKQSPGTFLTASLRRTLLCCRDEIVRLQAENEHLWDTLRKCDEGESLDWNAEWEQEVGR